MNTEFLDFILWNLIDIRLLGFEILILNNYQFVPVEACRCNQYTRISTR